MKTFIYFYFFIASTFLISNVEAANEVWETKIIPPWISPNGSLQAPMGYAIWYTLEFEKAADGTLTGNVDIRSPQARCAGNAEFEYGSIKDGIIKIKSKPIPVPQCGYFYFQGKVEGDKWVGYIPWNSAKNEAIFTKSK